MAVRSGQAIAIEEGALAHLQIEPSEGQVRPHLDRVTPLSPTEASERLVGEQSCEKTGGELPCGTDRMATDALPKHQQQTLRALRQCTHTIAPTTTMAGSAGKENIADGLVAGSSFRKASSLSPAKSSRRTRSKSIGPGGLERWRSRR